MDLILDTSIIIEIFDAILIKRQEESADIFLMI